jgi:FkbM family methyltransferase
MLASRLIRFWRFLEGRNNALGSKEFQENLNGHVLTLIKKFWNLRRPNDAGFSLSLYGVYLKERKQDVTFSLCKNGGYGTFLFDTLAAVQGPYVFLDIGANVGLYSLIAEKFPNIKSIHTFEPDPATLAYLRANIEFNNCEKVELHPYALSNRAGERILYSIHLHSGVSSLHDHDGANGSSSEVESVATPYLDANIRVPTHSKVIVKIDVEGHELFALESLFAWRHAEAIDQIFIEFDTRMSEVQQLTDLLIANNFRELRRTGISTHWDALWSR